MNQKNIYQIYHKKIDWYILYQFDKIKHNINESFYTNLVDIFWYLIWPLKKQVSDPGGSELRPRPALTALWSLGTLQVLPRSGEGSGGELLMESCCILIPFWKVGGLKFETYDPLDKLSSFF